MKYKNYLYENFIILKIVEVKLWNAVDQLFPILLYLTNKYS